MNEITIITGVTCSGKSSLAVDIAKKSDAIIINADASQLYNELKILTAFPSKNDMQAVPHRLFGILSAEETSSVADWCSLVAKEIESSDKNVIICGGTGFYIDALTHGIANIPQIPEAFRKEVFEEFQKIGREEFYKKLCKLAPENKLHPNDTQRILRAYEVVAYTGKSLQNWWKNQSGTIKNYKMKILIPDRETLAKRCRLRLYKMLSNGLLEEFQDFISRYPNYNGVLTKVIGYQESLLLTESKISQNEFIDEVLTKTMQYAKRQSTYFRNRFKEHFDTITDKIQ